MTQHFRREVVKIYFIEVKEDFLIIQVDNLDHLVIFLCNKDMFVASTIYWFDALSPSQQFVNHVVTINCFPVLNYN